MKPLIPSCYGLNSTATALLKSNRIITEIRYTWFSMHFYYRIVYNTFSVHFYNKIVYNTFKLTYKSLIELVMIVLVKALPVE